jgi:hypothetical protein
MSSKSHQESDPIKRDSFVISPLFRAEVALLLVVVDEVAVTAEAVAGVAAQGTIQSWWLTVVEATEVKAIT